MLLIVIILFSPFSFPLIADTDRHNDTRSQQDNTAESSREIFGHHTVSDKEVFKKVAVILIGYNNYRQNYPVAEKET